MYISNFFGFSLIEFIYHNKTKFIFPVSVKYVYVIRTNIYGSNNILWSWPLENLNTQSVVTFLEISSAMINNVIDSSTGNKNQW